MDKHLYDVSVEALYYMAENKDRHTEQQFAVITSDGGYEVSDFTICMAGIKGMKNEAVASLTQHKSKDNCEGRALSTDELELFLDWLCNRSPYSQCILAKFPKFIYHFGIVLDSSYPANLVVGAAIAHRIAWEYTCVAENMLNFIGAGMNESAAFVIAHQYGVKGGDRVYNSCHNGHTAVYGGSITPEYLCNFVNGKLISPNSSLQVRNGKYDGISDLWGDVDNTFDFLAGIPKKENNVPNPFANTLILEGAEAGDIREFVAYINSIVES